MAQVATVLIHERKRPGLIPLDSKSRGALSFIPKALLALASQPLERPLVFRQIRFEFPPNIRIMIFDPLPIILGQHTGANHLRLDRNLREPLESKESISFLLTFRLYFFDEQRRLDTDAKLAVLVESRFVGNYVAWL